MRVPASKRLRQRPRLGEETRAGAALQKAGTSDLMAGRSFPVEAAKVAARHPAGRSAVCLSTGGGAGRSMLTSFGIGALVGVGVVAGVLGYWVGRITGKRAERRLWEERIARQARELGRTRTMIRQALQDKAHQPIDR